MPQQSDDLIAISFTRAEWTRIALDLQVAELDTLRSKRMAGQTDQHIKDLAARAKLTTELNHRVCDGAGLDGVFRIE